MNYAGLGRNIGIKVQKVNSLLLDSDDYWDKNKLKFQIAKCIKIKLMFFLQTLKLLMKKKIIYCHYPWSLNFNDLIKACPVCYYSNYT